MVKAGDIVKVKVLEVLQRKRIALTMRLDEQPGETNAAAAVMNARKTNRPEPNRADDEAQPAGNRRDDGRAGGSNGQKR